ncbi:spore gernimation protein [Siminovitchia acidinfaciens]|uniref:Spore gernimation protein n=1 Tax=Siminovitchia acidinfaciens TaxID=2321395 RepID=A0A429XZT8_9BACI|nr:endospore germination permease [Siminovitchia acidinfaciens]RST74334.1 spore gernimation protein [Siminovitchia acidinfaciens]
MEKGKISSLQMAILLYPTIIATAILSFPSKLASFVGNDLWMPPIIASSAGLIVIFIAFKLHKYYPGKTIIQQNEEILGRIPGKIISFIILFFYIESTGEITRAYSEFIVTSFLLKTPQIVVISSMVLLCAFCVYGGLEVLARLGQLLFPLFVLPIFLLLILVGPDLNFGNIFPLFDVKMKPLMKASFQDAGLFAEYFLIIFLLPFLSDQGKGRKYGIISVLGVMMTLLITNLIVLFVLGPTVALKTYPLMNVSRFVQLGGFFENMEAVVMAVWIAGAFIKISVYFYAVVLGTAQCLNLSDFRPVIWPIAILIVQLSYWRISSTMQLQQFDTTIFPFYSTIVQILLPLLLLGIAAIRQKKQ